jgi:hypothetical protein
MICSEIAQLHSIVAGPRISFAAMPHNNLLKKGTGGSFSPDTPLVLTTSVASGC